MAELNVAVQECPNPAAKIIALKGEMDETSLETLRVQLEPFLNDGNVRAVIFNLQDLSFINSKGIGYVVSVHTHLSKDQRKLILVAAQEAVMDVINLVGLTTIIPYFGTIEEACQSLS